MYTIIVNNDNTLYGSRKRKIMQKEKLFNKLCFLVPPHYNGYDMSRCTVTMRYLMPISRDFKTETLVLSDERYEEYLKYVLPVDTCLTKEWGNIELNLTFTMLDAEQLTDENGRLVHRIVQRVRRTENHILAITKLPDWDSVVPDSALSALDQRILKQDAQIKALAQLAENIEGSKVDNLVYDSVGETLQLTANGIGIGNKVSIRDMIDEGIPVVDLDFNIGNGGSDNDTNVDDDCNCGDCGCEEDFDVVEF